MAQELDIDEEPLGYQHFLCDVNIEYSPGGNRNYSSSNKHSFKLKCLPYMVSRSHLNNKSNNNNNSDIKVPLKQHHESSLESSASSSSRSSSNSNIFCDLDRSPNQTNSSTKNIDVTRATCAFLSNSDYVPNHNFNTKRVVLELISARLSQSVTFNVPPNLSYTNLVTLSEQHHQDHHHHHHHQYQPQTNNHSSSNLNRCRTPSTSTLRRSNENLSSNTSISSSSSIGNDTSPSSPSHSSSKRFVNYTILIKTTPGLDKNPALIERRFSDFLLLYQGLKCQKSSRKLVDTHITFPKKVYVGNFLLTNIAERSIEFSRLLNLCMTNIDLLWSVPFISFLLDKELKEAHKLSLCGDPDDVQVLIETAYYIEQKLYLSNKKDKTNNKSSLSSISLDTSSGNSSGSSGTSTANDSFASTRALTNGVCDISNNHSVQDDTNTEENQSRQYVDNNSPQISANSPTLLTGNSPNQSFCDNNNEETFESFPNRTAGALNFSALNQRILVTFCMLFVTYYRGENYRELKIAVKEFSQMIIAKGYVDSVIKTRHYVTLRACLLFLMNMNRGGVIDENQRIWLKRMLEGIDGIHAEFDESLVSNDKESKNRKMKNNGDVTINGCTDFHRIVTKGDLMSLIRDRNFCSFQPECIKATK